MTCAEVEMEVSDTQAVKFALERTTAPDRYMLDAFLEGVRKVVEVDCNTGYDRVFIISTATPARSKY
jgi:hypothetical protein